MADQQTIQAFTKGIHNLLPDDVIPRDAASHALNWITRDGKIELTYGRRVIGGDGAAGKNYGEHTGYRADGTPVRFRKVGGAVQYLDGDTWTDVITGLSNGDVTFANYQSLAGAFVFVFSPVDGIFKIATANPGSYAALYNSSVNFKGYGLIDKGRTLLWGRLDDPTGLYGSHIDPQDGDVYTVVSSEATTSLSGTLNFKGGGATRTCFGVEITLTSSGEVYTDDFNGHLTGSLGGTGTINYMTGAYTLSNPGTGTADYQWEDSNDDGLTDFTKSSTRLAGEGFILRQDSGGDAIITVIPLDGSYLSIKKNSAYALTLDAEDVAPVNEILRTDIGVPSLRASVGTSQGIVFVNTSNPSKPQLHILRRNPLGDNFDIQPLFPHFRWEDFLYDDAAVDTWDRYILISCRTPDSLENNRLILANVAEKTVDVTYYGARTFTKSSGFLYGGDPVSKTTFELFTGFDDNGIAIANVWASKGENYRANALKKTKRYRYGGLISPSQMVSVYLVLDDGDRQLIGTIRGDGNYVDYSSSFAIGTAAMGTAIVGGDSTTSVYRFLMEIKVRAAKFSKRRIEFEATGIGYVAIDTMTDFDIWQYENKLPKRYRQKQNVSLDGATADLAEPQF